MFSTCIFCKRPLGRNEAVESFPVGRRLAFDPAKGRLWVVCRRCERWNLTPLEERWEALEECERLFRGTRLRMSTDNVGLAKLKEGLVLVRIGEPLRPEFAAWRYGDQFGRRRRRAMVWVGAGVVLATALTVGSVAVGIGAGMGAQIPNLFINVPVRAKIRTRDGKILKLRTPDIDKARFLMEPGSDEWVLTVKKETFEGAEAMRAAAQILPALNLMSGSKVAVANAVAKIEEAGDPERYLARASHELDPDNWQPGYGKPLFPGKPGLMKKLPAPTRLALEMALHEEREMRALAGELLELEMAWREAEAIAAIADNMFVPPAHDAFIEQHRPAEVSARAAAVADGDREGEDG
ncbi:MAG: hypothetical protein JSW43_13410 [Gemmatimonadota bacterium]|nr:MAG: hypothetical protein JSW43_13410 [Gemmatimonadota bacterium]